MNGLTHPEKYKKVSKLDQASRNWELWRNLFFRYYRQLGSYTAAADALGIPVKEIKKLKDSDPDFAASFQSATEDMVSDLEGVAFSLAKGGDRDMIKFLLRRHEPAYRENAPAQPTNVVVMKTYIGVTPDAWDEYRSTGNINQIEERNLIDVIPQDKGVSNYPEKAFLDEGEIDEDPKINQSVD